jgi:hypothetical protein
MNFLKGQILRAEANKIHTRAIQARKLRKQKRRLRRLAEKGKLNAS